MVITSSKRDVDRQFGNEARLGHLGYLGYVRIPT